MFNDASISVEHEAFQFISCSNKAEEFFIGYNEEELWHVNFDQKTGVLTSPNFTGPLTFDEFYNRGVHAMVVCKSNLHNFRTGLENPPPEMGKTCTFCTFE